MPAKVIIKIGKFNLSVMTNIKSVETNQSGINL